MRPCDNGRREEGGTVVYIGGLDLTLINLEFRSCKAHEMCIVSIHNIILCVGFIIETTVLLFKFEKWATK